MVASVVATLAATEVSYGYAMAARGSNPALESREAVDVAPVLTTDHSKTRAVRKTQGSSKRSKRDEIQKASVETLDAVSSRTCQPRSANLRER